MMKKDNKYSDAPLKGAKLPRQFKTSEEIPKNLLMFPNQASTAKSPQRSRYPIIDGLNNSYKRTPTAGPGVTQSPLL